VRRDGRDIRPETGCDPAWQPCAAIAAQTRSAGRRLIRRLARRCGCHASKLPRPLAIRLHPSGVMDRLKIHPEQGERERIRELVLLQRAGLELRLRVFFVEPEAWARWWPAWFLEGDQIKDRSCSAWSSESLSLPWQGSSPVEGLCQATAKGKARRGPR